MRALAAWLPGGPLGKGWARRAGTPASLLPARTATAQGGGGGAGGAVAPSPGPFQAQLSGTARQSEVAGGLVEIDLTLAVQGAPLSALDIRIFGTPAAGGGVAMNSSDVTLGTSSDPQLYRGSVTGLQGTNVVARVSSPGRAPLALTAALQIDPATGAVTGTLAVAPSRR